MYLVECGHCPSSQNRFVADDPEAAMATHITTAHPGTGQWQRGNDWDVLSEVDVAALDSHPAFG